MPKYTVAFTANPILRFEEDGEEIEFKASILRDGKEVASIEQRYGIAMPDEEMHSDLSRQVEKLILDDYRKIKRSKAKDRADAAVAVFDRFEVDLP